MQQTKLIRKNKIFFILLPAILLLACMDNKQLALSDEVQQYLDGYNKTYQELATFSSAAEWTLNTRIVEGDTLSKQIAEKANEALADFTGSAANIQAARKYLLMKDSLTAVQVRQLQAILYMAGNNPATAGELVKEKIKAGTDQVEKLYGFDFKIDGKSVTTNDIDKILTSSADLNQRLKAWESSKEVGRGLKEGLLRLRELRNQCVQALDYPDYFSYQVSEYGLSAAELTAISLGMIAEIWPLYRELHTWARYELAKKYKQPVPDMLPAHWLPNRWGQSWDAMVETEGIDLDKVLQEKSAEWIVKEGEKFYMSLGFEALPASFYEKSSLYPLPDTVSYKKNNHASAWHIDYEADVRSLMSIVPNTSWWGTTLHELGHIYYYMEYSNPDVPVILRAGANRAFHEAMGSLMGLAALQKPFLQHLKLIPATASANDKQAIQLLLKEALEHVVLIPWGAGVMTDFEYELYANSLPIDRFNEKWWELVKKYQGIIPPYERGEEYCDAASKTHINDDPAQYYDYPMSHILLFQFHEHIAKNILKQDPRATNYYGNKEIGNFLKAMMYPGANVDWREHLRKHIGSDMSARAMVNYFEPLMPYLKAQNKGRKYTLPERIK